MNLTWIGTPPATGLHPKLDPVAAWMFARDSEFLRTGDAENDAAMLYAMTIGASGFDPREGAGWRALAVPNPRSSNIAADAFSLVELEPSVRAQLGAVPDARVDVVPLHADSALPSAELLARQDLASPNGNSRPRRPLPRPKAIIGVIDHGINFFHHRFRRGPDSSRVAFAWDQSAIKGDDKLPFGREWRLPDIENALADAGRDEDALLRQIGGDPGLSGFQPLVFRASHGTHVLDLAAGFEPDDISGHEYPIIVVNLPAEVSRETSGSLLALPYCLGLSYIADRARWLFHEFRQMLDDTGEVAPVFVNFSFGLTGGPRDGLHRLERTIEKVAALHRETVRKQPGFATAQAPLTVVTAAGNNNLAQGHARSPAGATQLDLLWQIQPADPTPNVVEFRVVLPASSPANDETLLKLLLTPPGGVQIETEAIELSSVAGPTPLFWLVRDDDQTVLGHLSGVGVDGRMLCLTLVIAATDPSKDTNTAARAGLWRVSCLAENFLPERIDAWILRDDVPGGFRDTGRQSYFIDPRFTRFFPSGRKVTEDQDDGSVIRRAGSLNAIATAEQPFSDPHNPQDRLLWVAGAAHQICLLSGAPVAGATDYSAAPLDNTAERIDLSAFGDRSRVTSGVLAAGTRSGSRVALSGTSVAAPQVLRFFVTGEGRLEDVGQDMSQRLGPVVRSNL